MSVPDFSRVDLHAPPASGANGMGWADLVAAQTGESPDLLTWATPEGFGVRRLYTAEDRAPLDFCDTYPGLEPYLRGPYATMYATQPWTIRQYAGSPPPRIPTPSTGATWLPARRACRWPSTWPPIGATTPTTSG